MQGSPPLSKGYLQHFCQVGLGDWAHPSNRSPVVGSCLRIFHALTLGSPCSGKSPGDLLFDVPRTWISCISAATGMSVATRAVAAAAALLADGVAHLFHLFFKHCHCHQGPSVGVPCTRAIIPFIRILFHSSELLICVADSSSKLHMGISLRDVGWQLPLFTLWQCAQMAT